MLNTAPTLLKLSAAGNHLLLHDISLQTVLRKLAENKGYDLGILRDLGNRDVFGTLVEHLLLHQGTDQRKLPWDYMASTILAAPRNANVVNYRGTPQQNLQIDRALFVSHRPENGFIGESAAATLSLPRLPPNFDHRVLNTPIAIVGYGAAGILIHSALRNLGFSRTEVFEKREVAGIWSQKNVAGGTRNNPRTIAALGISLDAAPGSGQHVFDFLRKLGAFGSNTRNHVRQIQPGNLEHKLFLNNGSKQPLSFPIVINTIGLGKPRPLSDPSKMLGNETHVPAVRWQQPDLTVQQVHNSRFIFVGLGNSTAEMIRQLHAYEDKGYNVDYRIITHYPRDALFNPMDEVWHKQQNFRVFRDLSKPNLTSYQGDLPLARKDYYRALLRNRIIGDVKKWEVTANKKGKQKFGVVGKLHQEFDYDNLFVLTGYKHDRESLERMGVSVDAKHDCPRYDFDGEFHRPRGDNERLYKGYFGLGAVLDAPHNRNSIVIPGIIFRAPDLLFGVIMRAAEYVRTRQA